MSPRRWLAEAEFRLGHLRDSMENFIKVLRQQEEPPKLHRRLFQHTFRSRVEQLSRVNQQEARSLCRRAVTDFLGDLGPKEVSLVHSMLPGETLSPGGGKSNTMSGTRARVEEKRERTLSLKVVSVRTLPHMPGRVFSDRTGRVMWAATRAKRPYLAVQYGDGQEWTSPIRGTPICAAALGKAIVAVCDSGWRQGPDESKVNIFLWSGGGEVVSERAIAGHARWAVVNRAGTRILSLFDPYSSPRAVVLDAHGSTVREFSLRSDRGWGMIRPGPGEGWWVHDWTTISLLDREGHATKKFELPRIRSRLRSLGLSIRFDASGHPHFSFDEEKSSGDMSSHCGLREDFALLGIDPTTDISTLRSAYHKRALATHPDINPSPRAHERMVQLNLAYERLKSARLDELAHEKDSEDTAWVSTSDCVASMATSNDGSRGLVVCRSGNVYELSADGLKSIEVPAAGVRTVLCLDSAAEIGLMQGEGALWSLSLDGAKRKIPETGSPDYWRAWSLEGTGVFAVGRWQTPSRLFFIDALEGKSLGCICFPDPVRDAVFHSALNCLLVAAGRSLFSVTLERESPSQTVSQSLAILTSAGARCRRPRCDH